jgi:glycosyltransferase involved in cell wall biosynthesis
VVDRDQALLPGTIPRSMSRVRVIELAAFDQEQPGSFVPLLAGIMAEVSRRGWRGEIVLPESARGRPWLSAFDSPRARVRFLPYGSRRSLAARIQELLDADEDVVLHTHFTRFDLAAALAAQRSPRVSTIWHVHTTLHRGPAAFARNSLKYGIAGRFVDAILCPSTGLGMELRHRCAPADRIEVVPSAIDLQRYPLMSPSERAEARAARKIRPGSTVLLHFGWDWELKGGDLMLDAVRVLLEREPGIDLVVLTRDSAEGRRAVRRAGLEDVVQLLGPVPDVRQLYAAADVLLASSVSEGMPFTMVESLASGTPVVATDIPGHAYVGKEVDACRIAASEGAALAGAIEETLARRPDRADAETEAARAWLAENLSLETVCRQLGDVFARQATAS